VKEIVSCVQGKKNNGVFFKLSIARGSGKKNYDFETNKPAEAEDICNRITIMSSMLTK
jgi:hypothetical protein